MHKKSKCLCKARLTSSCSWCPTRTQSVEHSSSSASHPPLEVGLIHLAPGRTEPSHWRAQLGRWWTHCTSWGATCTAAKLFPGIKCWWNSCSGLMEPVAHSIAISCCESSTAYVCIFSYRILSILYWKSIVPCLQQLLLANSCAHLSPASRQSNCQCQSSILSKSDNLPVSRYSCACKPFAIVLNTMDSWLLTCWKKWWCVQFRSASKQQREYQSQYQTI